MKLNWFCLSELHNVDECSRIKEFVLDNRTNTIEDLPAKTMKTASVDHAHWGTVQEALKKMHHAVLDINRRYFGFNIFEVSNFDTVHVNTYSSENNGEYSWHTDGVNDEIFDSKLTAILNLSTEEYEGGDFELFLSEPTTIETFKLPGSLVVFPSFINHRVTPVTKGTRVTLAHWYVGPNWQ
jgi:PKHD-type hydroxylase